MSWSNIGNPSQDPITTNLPNAVGNQPAYNTYNLAPIQIPTINTPPTTAIPSIPIPSFEQILASTLQQNNFLHSSILPSFTSFLPHLPPLAMNPYDSRSYPANTTAWSRPYGIAYTQTEPRTTGPTTTTGANPQPHYSAIPAKRVHPESNRSDRHASDVRQSSDIYTSRHSSSRGSSSSDRNHYDSSKRHKSGSERSSTSSMRPSSSSHSSNYSSGTRRGESQYASISSRPLSTHGSHGSSRSTNQQRSSSTQPPPPPPPAAKSTGVLNTLNGRVTLNRFQEYARLIGAYPYLRNLLAEVPSQFELSSKYNDKFSNSTTA